MNRKGWVAGEDNSKGGSKERPVERTGLENPTIGKRRENRRLSGETGRGMITPRGPIKR